MEENNTFSDSSLAELTRPAYDMIDAIQAVSSHSGIAGVSRSVELNGGIVRAESGVERTDVQVIRDGKASRFVLRHTLDTTC